MELLFSTRTFQPAIYGKITPTLTRDLNRQKIEAQIDQWKAELDKFSAQAKGASADARLRLNALIEKMQKESKEAEDKLSAMAEVSDEALESLNDRLESTWRSLQSVFEETPSEFEK